MAKKLTQKEWFDKFDKEFRKEIFDFRTSGTTLFNNDDITQELRYCVGAVVRHMYRVKMNIDKMEMHENRDEFTMTDYNGVQFFAAEYFKGSLSIGVMDKSKVVCGHVLSLAAYTENGASMDKLMRIIRYYNSVFMSMMEVKNHIEMITHLAGKRNI